MCGFVTIVYNFCIKVDYPLDWTIVHMQRPQLKLLRCAVSTAGMSHVQAAYWVLLDD